METLKSYLYGLPTAVLLAALFFLPFASKADVTVTNSGTSVNVTTSSSASSGGVRSDGDGDGSVKTGKSSASVKTTTHADDEGGETVIETETEEDGVVQKTTETRAYESGAPVEIRATASASSGAGSSASSGGVETHGIVTGEEATSSSTTTPTGAEATEIEEPPGSWFSWVPQLFNSIFSFFGWS